MSTGGVAGRDGPAVFGVQGRAAVGHRTATAQSPFMATNSDPVALYPDIATRGSLAAALQAAAERDGFSVPVGVAASDAFG